VRREHTYGIVFILALGAVGIWLVMRPPPQTKPPTASDATFSLSIATEAAAEASERPWVPAGKACRRAVTRGTRFEQVSDSILAALVIDGYDPATERFPLSKTAHVIPDGGEPNPSWGAYFVRDCRGDRVELDHALTEAQRANPSAVLAAPPALDPDDAGTEGIAHIERSDPRDSRMAVYAAVAVQYGYYFQCLGFEAIVRLDADELVVEGIGRADLYGCADKGNELHLAPLDGRVAILLPISVSTGESGDYESAWAVSLPERGALRYVGDVRRARGAGNATIMTGKWFGNMEAKLLDASALEVEETWQFVRYGTDGKETDGGTQPLVRMYTRGEGGLARSPTTDPTR
jgi:hypothetical protein